MTAASGGEEDRLDGVLRVLRERARARNAERVEDVTRLLRSGAAPTPEAVLEAASLCHAVAGSAGTFGDDRTTVAARALETALRAGEHRAVGPALHRLRALTTGVGDVRDPGS
ncbi:Hpt domain-containing protein [Cellulosimicrobium cellulans]|uniref:Hpt domain-containing protein n=1 Tax=Cellulosimicrobium cellulans TaxID=1710 RepID=UPI0028A5F80B|nr:Hpt domain-containing protein [Cellulosimicrobium cellulans]